jgi:TPR repeat protein
VRGCNNLGVLYETGAGVDKDASQAVFFYRKACDGGDMVGCQYLGMMYAMGSGVQADQVQAAFFKSKACAGGDQDACEKPKPPQ